VTDQKLITCIVVLIWAVLLLVLNKKLARLYVDLQLKTIFKGFLVTLFNKKHGVEKAKVLLSNNDNIVIKLYRLGFILVSVASFVILVYIYFRWE